MDDGTHGMALWQSGLSLVLILPGKFTPDPLDFYRSWTPYQINTMGVIKGVKIVVERGVEGSPEGIVKGNGERNVEESFEWVFEGNWRGIVEGSVKVSVDRSV